MFYKINWILILFAFPFMGYADEPCNPFSWNNSLNHFNQLESNYNRHVKVFNEHLVKHKQRPLLSKEFDFEELTTLWRVSSRKDLLQTQLNTSLKYRQVLKQKADALLKLSTQSILSANRWEKLAQSCKNADEVANQVSAELYHFHANQLAEDCHNLASQYLGLANLYNMEAEILQRSQHKQSRK